MATNFFEEEQISYTASKFGLSTTIFTAWGTFQSLTCSFRFLQNLKILSTLIGSTDLGMIKLAKT